MEQEQERRISCHGSAKVSDKKINDNFEFSIDMNDTIFNLTLNYTNYCSEKVGNSITKMAFIKESYLINLLELSKVLAAMNISELYIFSIDDRLDRMKVIKKDNGSRITYAEMRPEQFITLLNSNVNFLDYNKHSLYILRDGSYLGIKNLFAKINGYEINVGRGGGQKAHILSPLDLRLASYLMAMFNFDYRLITYLNEFHDLEKDRYLSYKNMEHSVRVRRIRRVRYTESKEFKPIYIQNFLNYSSNNDLDLDLQVLRCTPCPECNEWIG